MTQAKVREALVIAAGMGSRLDTLGPSKPLTHVNGKPLIARTIAQLAAAGIERVTVVTGHMAQEVEDFLATIAEVDIATVRISDWSTPNGHSVLAGMAGLNGTFVLCMSDHLCEPELIERLIAYGAPVDGLTLAVDLVTDRPTTDLDDATKVWCGGGDAIVDIGKQLERYDAIDTGFFLATPALAAALRAAIAEGAAGSLSDGVKRLAGQGKAKVADIGNCRWIDVDTAEMHALAERVFT